MYVRLSLDFLYFGAKIYKKRIHSFLLPSRSPQWFQLYSLQLANDFENQLVFDKITVMEWIADSLFVL